MSPTQQQQRIIEYPLSPLLVVAGAGSGKTATMTQRIIYLIATGQVRPDEVLGLTFTTKATAELDHRVALSIDSCASHGLIDLPEDTGQPHIATYNSFAGMIVRDYGLRLGMDPDTTLVTEARAWQIMTELVEGYEKNISGFKSVAAVADNALALAGKLQENLLSIEDARLGLADLTSIFEELVRIPGRKGKTVPFLEKNVARESLLGLVEAYVNYKRAHSLMDYGDQVAFAYKIVSSEPSVCRDMASTYSVCRDMASTYKAIVLDEFQDTSIAQIKMLATLFSGMGVTAVGDPNQAIYGWRGASAGALNGFHAAFTHQEQPRDVLNLSTSWRNDALILDVANAVSKPLRDNNDGIAVPELQTRSVITGEDMPAGIVLTDTFIDAQDEAEAVARFMKQHSAPGRSMAVLCRTNKQFDPIQKALTAQGIDSVVVAGNGLLTTPIVHHLVDALHVAVNPEEGVCLMALLDRAGLGASDIRSLYAAARALAYRVEDTTGKQGIRETPVLSDAVELCRYLDVRDLENKDGNERIAQAHLLSAHERRALTILRESLSDRGARICRRIHRQITTIRQSMSLPLPRITHIAERALNLDIEASVNSTHAGDHIALRSFHQVAAQFIRDLPEATLREFLSWLEAAKEREGGLSIPQTVAPRGVVHILTVHAAKGLEWEVVAVPGMTEKQFPHYAAEPDMDDPSKPVGDSGWLTKNEFPHPLRADVDVLPPCSVLQCTSATSKEDFSDCLDEYRLALGEYIIAEERRLAYVAFTRAQHALFVSGSYFTGQSTKPKPISRFLRQIRGCEGVRDAGWGVDTFPPNATNCALDHSESYTWPTVGQRENPVLSEARQRAVQAVRDAQASMTTLPRWSSDEAAERAATIDMLIRHERMTNEGPSVRVPAHMPATSIEKLAQTPDDYALTLRRPMPQPPKKEARLGTIFHEAIAERLRGQSELLSMVDAGIDDGLAPKERELLTKWFTTVESLDYLSNLTLRYAEVDRDLRIGDVIIRCRIDAVFSDCDGRWYIIDWKTGKRPVSVDQLSLYVHAWATSEDIDPAEITAAYIYVDKDPDDPAIIAKLPPDQLQPIESLPEILRASTLDESSVN
ncbi:ATP-dependent helicase [Actinomyces vulturis]|uniref:ATP-dependent helicase n=1 Tax=Actinomyces vulturis TaxID=1857645 RepID=UPI00159ED2AE|nr:ATP-dependent DNA helicase [Actinomyces vulturis]